MSNVAHRAVNAVAADMLRSKIAAAQLLGPAASTYNHDPATLPTGLQEYAPATHWHPDTVRWWERLAGLEVKGRRGAPVLVPDDEWVTIRNDVIRTTGYTVWMDITHGGPYGLMFAGNWIEPELKPYQPALKQLVATLNQCESRTVIRIQMPPHWRRLRVVTGINIVQLQIPKRSLRGPLMINQDAAYVDKRRLARMHRRFQRQAA